MDFECCNVVEDDDSSSSLTKTALQTGPESGKAARRLLRRELASSMSSPIAAELPANVKRDREFGDYCLQMWMAEIEPDELNYVAPSKICLQFWTATSAI